jgi:hypothetical protein
MTAVDDVLILGGRSCVAMISVLMSWCCKTRVFPTWSFVGASEARIDAVETVTRDHDHYSIVTRSDRAVPKLHPSIAQRRALNSMN